MIKKCHIFRGFRGFPDLVIDSNNIAKSFRQEKKEGVSDEAEEEEKEGDAVCPI